MSEVKNLVVFMSDGVRWDAHPESVRERGVTYRTVASSTHTPTSIASMLTGQYLGNHNVRGFTDPLDPNTRTVLDAFDNSGISDFTGNFNNEIYDYLLGRYDRVSLDEIDEPFAWFMRDPGGHAPYDGFDDDLASTESVDSYLREHAGDTERMRSDYEAGVEASVRRFETHVLDTLTERGIDSETLVVFVSDHGQMLGEYGHVGESYPAAPEVVYVPVTFVHPSLDSRESDRLFRHVDLPDTVAGFTDADVDPGTTDGVDHASGDHSPDHGLCLYDRPYPSFRGQFHYTLQSVWGGDGGHVFNESSLWERLKLLAGLLASIPAGRQLRRSRSLTGVRYLLRDRYSWGDPGIDTANALDLLDSIETEYQRADLQLDEEAQENLEDLGYL